MKEFDKIIGYETIKKELMQISDVLKNGEEYKKLGVKSPTGLLLYGPPGVGKTLMANAVIKASGRRAFLCRKDKPNGDFIKAIKKTFRDAAEAAPSVVFLDDMDKFTNGDDRHPDAEEYVTVQSCIDEIKGKEVFVLATVNNIRVLPRSLYRAGRFDRKIEVSNPRGKDAELICAHYIGQKKFVGDMDAESVGRVMEGHSCAELETVINEAGLYAGFERSDEITKDHFMKACLHTVYDVPNEVLNGTPEKPDLTDREDQRTLVAYHEAGHATVAEVLNPGSVTLVSAYSRDGGTGGFTSYCSGMTGRGIAENCAHVCRSLGSVAALEQKFGVIESGTDSDLDMGFKTVWDLVTNNCSSGLILHSNGYDDSEELKANQERAVAAEVERYYKKTKEIIAVNHELLDAIAFALSEKGVLTAEDIANIRNSCAIVPVKI